VIKRPRSSHFNANGNATLNPDLLHVPTPTAQVNSRSRDLNCDLVIFLDPHKATQHSTPTFEPVACPHPHSSDPLAREHQSKLSAGSPPTFSHQPRHEHSHAFPSSWLGCTGHKGDCGFNYNHTLLIYENTNLGMDGWKVSETRDDALGRPWPDNRLPRTLSSARETTTCSALPGCRWAKPDERSACE
jgi:hypothetical protein